MNGALFKPIVPAPSDIVLTSPRKLSLFGSTGSIGVQTLDLVRRFPDRNQIFSLVGGTNLELLVKQSVEFQPRIVGIADQTKYLALREAVKNSCPNTAVVTGDDIHCIGALPEVDLVVSAIVGIAGLHSTVKAVEAGKIIALANKESLVCGGRWFSELCRKKGAWIIPVDSEHSAIFQALQGSHYDDVESLILTASGGPFKDTPINELAGMTPEQALRHPRWKMGPKVTIDSATMFNKALELMEAHYLFGLSEDKIKIVVHPQSIVHSLVSYVDGSQIAQLGAPDMRVPIAYALSYPDVRIPNAGDPLKLVESSPLQFEPLDNDKFPAPELARVVLRKGAGYGVIFNAANEMGVLRFLEGKIRFTQIFEQVSSTIERYHDAEVGSFDDIIELDRHVRSTF